MMHNVRQAVPDNLRGMFRLTTDVHNSLTRSASNQSYYVDKSRTEKMKRSFARTGAVIWNGLPQFLKSLRKYQFKAKIKQILSEILQKTDDYIEVPQILSNIKQMKT